VGDFVEVMDGSKKGHTGEIVGISQKDRDFALKIRSDKINDVISVWHDQAIRWQPPWIRPHIVVRVINSSAYRGEKAIVQDVSKQGMCTLKTFKGVILDHVQQRHVETVIPPEHRTVMVLVHKDRRNCGQLGELLEIDDRKNFGFVRVDSTFEILVFLFSRSNSILITFQSTRLIYINNIMPQKEFIISSANISNQLSNAEKSRFIHDPGCSDSSNRNRSDC
jgi:ribosomal protein L24